jgi:uncharacterized membrane protein YphA (DoxX/SURF4 family)
MNKIEFEEPPRIPVLLAMTMLRLLTGLAVGAFGLQKLGDMAGWQSELTRLGVTNVEVAGPCSVFGALLVGAGLVVGWLTRTWSFALLSASVAALVVTTMRGALAYLDSIEFLSVLMAVALVLWTTGCGKLSADHWLFERKRRRAILSDERWSQPPYVPAPAALYASREAPGVHRALARH